jgi:hypothetical protein
MGEIVEDFNNRRLSMATVNFSVPDEIKAAFDAAFAGENKSAVVARLMREAVEQKRRLRRRVRVAEALLALRRAPKPVTTAAVRRARVKGRP